MSTAPEINKTYTARGYLFRVDHVANGEVFCTRWSEDNLPCYSDLVRVSIETWNREMATEPQEQQS